MDILNTLLKSALLLSLLSFSSSAQTFEQNGVKDGNIRLSVSLYTEQPEDEPNSANFDALVGYFVSSDIETMISVGLEKMKGADEFYYRLTPGVNYYFYKAPIFTPYIGARLYYWNSSYEYIKEKKGSSLCIGSHLFVNENVAITPEFGVDFIDFDTNDGTYFSTSLTYFF